MGLTPLFLSRTSAILQLLLLLVVVFLAPSAHAADPRHVDATSFGDSVSLGAEWLFHPGDDPRWASPTFDDHDWTVVSTQRELTSYGFRGERYGWYRIHIRLRPGAPAPVVMLSVVFGSYDVFANGVRIGSHGRMDRNVARVQERIVGFPVPAQAIANGDLLLAIRFAFAPNGLDGPGSSTPIIDSTVALCSPSAYNVTANGSAAQYAFTYLNLAALALLIALVAFSLGTALRARGEYIAAGVYLLATAALNASFVWEYWKDFTFTPYLCRCILDGFVFVSLIEFIRLIVRQPRRRWIVALEAVTLLSSFAGLGYVAAPTQFIFRLGFYLAYLPLLAVNVVLLVLLSRALRGGNQEARFLLPAVLIGELNFYWQFVFVLLYYLRMTAVVPRTPSWTLGPWQFTLEQVCTLVFLSAMLLFLVLRTLRIARRNAQVSAELEAARTVQQVLVPEHVPTIPGFAIEAVYHPAGQVGGDFYQIIPVRSGGVLVVIGDVSGKGMPAAMTVSLLVGTVRTVAHYTQSPAEILTALNQRLVGRSNGGFTTAMVLRIDDDGTLTVANAGHLAPYNNGRELSVENGLPLGLVSDVEYKESRLQLAPSDTLTLLSDGVVEAQSDSGELFGFERTAAISHEPAEKVAQAARAFGQQDDITVVTLTLEPAAVLQA